MAQKVAGAKTKGWEPGTGPGWTIAPGRQSSNVEDLRRVGELADWRKRMDFFSGPNSNAANPPPALVYPWPLESRKGFIDNIARTEKSSWIQDPKGDYNYRPSTSEKMRINYGGIPGEFEMLSGLAPTKYEELTTGTQDIDVGVLDAFSPAVKRRLGQSRRAPGFGEALRLKAMQEITRNPIAGARKRRNELAMKEILDQLKRKDPGS
jgi:hypothetical protein